MTLANKITRIKCFSFLNLFSIDSFFVLFAAILLSRLNNLLSKSVLETKFACTNLALKTLAAKVLTLEL